MRTHATVIVLRAGGLGGIGNVAAVHATLPGRLDGGNDRQTTAAIAGESINIGKEGCLQTPTFSVGIAGTYTKFGVGAMSSGRELLNVL